MLSLFFGMDNPQHYASVEEAGTNHALPDETKALQVPNPLLKEERLYQDGKLLCKKGKYIEAVDLLEEAICLDHGPSHALLANMLIEGRPGFPKNRERAHELAFTGADLGCVHCCGVLAQCLVFGYGTSKKVEKGLALAKKSAEAGSFFGLYVLGFLEEDYSKSWGILMSAYTLGSVDASFRLGQIYENGYTFSDGSRFPKSYENAFPHYSRAAEQGHITAMMIVACWCEVGRGTNVDVQRALSLLREIASGSDKYYCDVHDKIVELSYNLDEIKAFTMMKNPVKDVAYCFDKHRNPIVRLNAIALYEILADKGHCNSQVWLAEDARKKKEFSRVAEYLMRAVEQGHTDSMCKLGDLVLHGTGVAKDPREAARLYQVAAEKGHQQAQLNLSYVLGEGIGVVQDKQEAKRWLVVCAEQGNSQAKFILKGIEESNQKAANKLQKKK